MRLREWQGGRPRMRRTGRGLRRATWLVPWILGCATAGSTPPDLPTPTPTPDRVLLISVSGLDADALEGGRSAQPLPTLSALAASGAYAERVVGVAPASAYPAHASLLTGVLPASRIHWTSSARATSWGVVAPASW